MANDTPMTDERLAEIRATLSDEEGMSDLAYRFTSEWASVRFKGDLAQAALDLLAEVERLRLREAEYEKQRADYHHVATELARCEHDHECTWQQARAVIVAHPAQEGEG